MPYFQACYKFNNLENPLFFRLPKDKLVFYIICIGKNYSIKKKFCRLTSKKMNANTILLKPYNTDKIYNKVRNIKYI